MLHQKCVTCHYPIASGVRGGKKVKLDLDEEGRTSVENALKYVHESYPDADILVSPWLQIMVCFLTYSFDNYCIEILEFLQVFIISMLVLSVLVNTRCALSSKLEC